jgi:hypothetical protein
MKLRSLISPLLIICSILALTSEGQAVSIDEVFNVRTNRGANPVGVLSGDLDVLGARSILPSGGSTTATATQGTTTVTLGFFPFTIFPNDYVQNIPFNATLSGSWTLTATDGALTTSVLTPPIVDPKVIPLVSGLHVTGTGLTPTIQWTLPSLTGLSVDRLVVRVWDLDHNVVGAVKDIIFDSPNLAPSATAFVIPSGVLEFGGHYSFNVIVDDLATPPGFFISPSNRSETWSDPFSPVPEPATLLLFGTTAAGLGVARWRARRRKQETATRAEL